MCPARGCCRTLAWAQALSRCASSARRRAVLQRNRSQAGGSNQGGAEPHTCNGKRLCSPESRAPLACPWQLAIPGSSRCFWPRAAQTQCTDKHSGRRASWGERSVDWLPANERLSMKAMHSAVAATHVWMSTSPDHERGTHQLGAMCKPSLSQ